MQCACRIKISWSGQAQRAKYTHYDAQSYRGKHRRGFIKQYTCTTTDCATAHGLSSSTNDLRVNHRICVNKNQILIARNLCARVARSGNLAMCRSNNHCSVLHSDSLIGRAVVCYEDFIALAKRLSSPVQRTDRGSQALLCVVGCDDEWS